MILIVLMNLCRIIFANNFSLKKVREEILNTIALGEIENITTEAVTCHTPKNLRRRWGFSGEADCCTEKRLAASGYKHASVRPCVFCRSTLLRVCHSESAHESQTFFGAADIPRPSSPPRRKFLLLFVAFLTLLCYYWSRTKAFGISERLFLLLKYTLTSINN